MKRLKEECGIYCNYEEVWKDMLPNLKYARGAIDGKEYVLEFIEGVDLQGYLYRWVHTPEILISKVKEFECKFFRPEKKNVVEFHPSKEFECVFGCICPINGESLKYTNIDLSFANLKLTLDGEVYNFDYEWVFDFLFHMSLYYGGCIHSYMENIEYI